MCGLFGMAGDMNYKDGDIVKMLALFSSTRGEDSTGAASVQASTNEIVVAKTLGHPFNLFDCKTFDSKVNNLHNKKAIIGHCRKATSGSVKISNAHPFAFGDDFVGVHNGTLRSWFNLPFRDEHDIDSQVLLRNIYEYGAPDVIPDIEGAYALVWYKGGDEDRLYFLRNDERSLYYAFSKDCRQIIWASERWMISVACSKHGKDLYTHPENGQSIFLFDKDMLYGFRLPEKYKQQISIEVEESLEGKKSKPGITMTGNYGYSHHSCSSTSSCSSGGGKEIQSPFELIRPTDPPDKEGVERTVGPERRLLPPAGTVKADESNSTTTHTSKSSSKSSDSPKKKDSESKTKLMQSSSPRPLLTLVQTSKNENSNGQGTLISDSEQSSLDDPLPDTLKEINGDYLRGPTGEYIDEEEYNKCTKYGCDWCGDDVTYEEAQKGGVGLWVGPKNFLCSECFERSNYTFSYSH